MLSHRYLFLFTLYVDESVVPFFFIPIRIIIMLIWKLISWLLLQAFSQVELWFSLDGDRYQGNSIRAVVPPDRTRESARNITVQLFTRPARFIRLRLSFADKWILLSEISFESGKSTWMIILCSYCILSTYGDESLLLEYCHTT